MHNGGGVDTIFFFWGRVYGISNIHYYNMYMEKKVFDNFFFLLLTQIFNQFSKTVLKLRKTNLILTYK